PHPRTALAASVQKAAPRRFGAGCGGGRVRPPPARPPRAALGRGAGPPQPQHRRPAARRLARGPRRRAAPDTRRADARVAAPAADLPAGTPPAAREATVFCIPATNNGTFTLLAALPGPGATSLPGIAQIVPTP